MFGKLNILVRCISRPLGDRVGLFHIELCADAIALLTEKESIYIEME